MKLDQALAACPVVAIIRGVRPDEAVAVAEALFAAGIRAVEVPLNSPEPLESIGRLAHAFAGRMLVGAGTVLRPDRVGKVAAAGALFSVSPNTSAEVITRALALGLEPVPGFGTATEAFQAIDAGARHLKLFPAATYGPAHVRQLNAVLPREATVLAVGGVGPDNFAAWWEAGARGFGLGSELYRAGMGIDEVSQRARRAVEAAAALT
jgi:2-dehydro-3-deoxyphosphogalactonate aldolase